MPTIRVELQLADGSFTTGMLRAGQSMAEFNKELVGSSKKLAALSAINGSVISSMSRAEGATKSFLETLRDVSIVTGLVSEGLRAVSEVTDGWIGDIIRVNAEMQKMSFQMRGLARSAEPLKEAGQSMEYLKTMATNAPFSIQTLTNAFVRLKAAGIDPMSGELQSLVDGVTAFGGTTDEFNRTILAISHMSGEGVVQLRQLRLQLGTAMPRAIELMARSMGVNITDLIKTISTGTVLAKPAIQGLADELERTYGGRAQAMMQTFNGQTMRSTTLLRNLALQIGGLKSDGTYGPNSFFGTITKQLIDFNQVLASPAALNFATAVGSSLTNLTQILQNTVGTLFRFRNEIMTVAEIVGSAFAFKAAMAGISQFAGALGTLSVSMKEAQIQFTIMKLNVERTAFAMQSASTADLAFGTSLTALRAGIVGVGTVISAALPWLAAIGIALYTASEYFDVFGQKTVKAYEDLKQFGAATRQEAVDITDAYIASLKAQIGDFENTLKMFPERIGQRNALLEKLQAELADAQASSAQLIADATKRQDDKAMEVFQDFNNDQLAAAQMNYDQREVQIQTHYDAMRAAAIKDNGSTVEVQKQRAKALYDSEIQEANDKIAIAQGGIAKLSWQQIAANEDQKREFKQQQAFLTGQLAQALDERQRLEDAGPAKGIQTGGKPPDDASAIKRGQSTLESLNKSVADLQTKLEGASGAVAAMQQAIANGDYGSVIQGGQAVQELHDKLLAATEQKELFDQLMKGQTQAEQDVNKARLDAIDRLAKADEALTGQKLDDAEKIKVKLNSGFYKGLGWDDAIKASIGDIIKGFDLSGDAATQVGKVFRENTFGDQTVAHINTVIDAVKNLTGALGGTGNVLNSLSFVNLGSSLPGMIAAATKPVLNDLPQQLSTRMQQMMTMLVSKGWSTNAAAGMTGNLAGESGINPNSYIADDNGQGPSAGIANWHGDRLDGLKAYAASQNKVWTDLTVQVDYLDKEMRTKFGALGGGMNLSASPQVASDMFMRGFEKPSNAAIAQSGPTRQGFAMQAAGMTGPISVAPETAAPPPAYVDEAGKYNQLLADRIAKTKELNGELDQTEAINKKAEAEEQQAAKIKALKDLQIELKVVGTDTDDVGKHFKALSKSIQDGKLGASTDVKDSSYAPLVAAAEALDAAEAKAAKSKAAQTSAASTLNGLQEKQNQLIREAAQAHAKMLNPTMVGETSAMETLTTETNKYLDDVEKGYGKDSDQYKAALSFKSQLLKAQSADDAQTTFEAMAKSTKAVQLTQLNETQQRTLTYNRAIALIDNQVAAAKAAGLDEVEITKQAEAQKAALRAQYEDQVNPVGAQMRQWSDLQGTLAQQSTQWMDGLASGLSGLVMGTGNLRDMVKGMESDVINDLTKYGISQLMNKGGTQSVGTSLSKLGGGTAKAGATSATSAAGGAAKKAAVGTAHTGGILGSSNLRMKTVSASVFAGAPRFHTGGIVGDEIPIIAKKGEGVFTPEQMASMGSFGGGNSMTISAPISIAAGGSPQQNQDLANRTSAALEKTIRALADEQILSSQRPGNAGNNRQHGMP